MEPSPPRTPRKGPLAVLERILLAAGAVILSVNVWTGFPVLALWIGSRFAGGHALSMLGIIATTVALAVLAGSAIIVLTRMSARYDYLAGRPPPTRQPAPWLRSMRSEREPLTRRRGATNPVEVVAIASVVLAVAAIEVWFFVFAHLAVPSGMAS